MSDKFKISLECDERALAKILIVGVNNGAIFTDVTPSDKAISNAPKPTRVIALPRQLVEGGDLKPVAEQSGKEFWTIDEICEYMRCGKSTFHTKYKRDPAFPKPLSPYARGEAREARGRRRKRYRAADVRAWVDNAFKSRD